ncbi:hypothetical protein [Alkalicoccus luteus]|uniref:Lipoprotein n=1 Tax=Alkalicoccus luteus TaxID=1237094 RepID=A0A969TWN5_9BACI|nr:hypothetical protein [Alkalicoccus luteus]NJP39412.1 hypothetical protein [Alkalicoccus luteus]
MMLQRVSIWAIMLLFVAACQNQDTLHFSNEGDNWEVDYTVNIYDENSQSIDYAIRYIGEESLPETLNYSIGSTTVTGEILSEGGVIEHSGSGCSGCAVTREDDDIEFSIEWDDEHEESFVLE